MLQLEHHVAYSYCISNPVVTELCNLSSCDMMNLLFNNNMTRTCAYRFFPGSINFIHFPVNRCIQDIYTLLLYSCSEKEGADEVEDEDDDFDEGDEGHADVETHQTTDTAEQRLDLERDHMKERKKTHIEAFVQWHTIVLKLNRFYFLGFIHLALKKSKRFWVQLGIIILKALMIRW